MGEDKLTPAQRLRLESFAQAVNSTHCCPLFIDPDVVAPPAGPDDVPQTLARIGPAGRERNPRVDPTLNLLLARAERIEAWLKSADA